MVLSIALSLAGKNAAVIAEPIYTSVKEMDCKKLSNPIQKIYESQGLAVDECPAIDGWRLFVVGSEERSWIDLSKGEAIWSTSQQVVYSNKNQFGYFPNINSEKASKVEWQTDLNKRAIGLIFRIFTVNGAVDKQMSRLFVIRLTESTPYFCGMANSNEEARKLADNLQMCTEALEKIATVKQ